MRRPAALTLKAVSVLAALLVAACADEGPQPSAPTVAGTVINSATGSPVAGAEVRIGDAVTTTGVDGRFELTDLTAGPATLSCTAAGFVGFEADVTVTDDRVTRNIEMTRIEVFEFGDFALYVPASVDLTQGILLSLGGPDTRAFATGKPFGAPVAEVEAALQALGLAFRELAATYGLALLGTSQAGMTNAPESDQLLLGAIQTAVEMSGRPELPAARMLLYGISGGAPQASGFTARFSERVAGLFLKVPERVETLTGGNPLRVPTYMVQAELDAFVDNAALTATFEANRGAGALWALAKEPAVPHHSLSPAQRQLTINWIRSILELRLPASTSDPLREIDETSGWLGDRAVGLAWGWAAYPGDRALASWLPSQALADDWEAFVSGQDLKVPDFLFSVGPWGDVVSPHEVTVKAGSVVRWGSEFGTWDHFVKPMDGSHPGGPVTASQRFRHLFSTPGTFEWYCPLHSEPDLSWGEFMTVIVTP